MRLHCTNCGTEFSVSVHRGPDDRSLDWTDGPHRCFVCGGKAEAIEEDEHEREELGETA